jgi:hypothetical protein
MQTITKLQNNQRVQIKGTKAYEQDAMIFSLRASLAEDGIELTPERLQRELSIGGKEFGIILLGVMMTNDRAYNEQQNKERQEQLHLSVGDTVELEGRLFTIDNDYNNNFKLVEVK